MIPNNTEMTRLTKNHHLSNITGEKAITDEAKRYIRQNAYDNINLITDGFKQ